MKKFWNWVRNEDCTRTLLIEGPIAEETWFSDEVTPKVFKEELQSSTGDVTIWMNSPGGDVFAAAQIYNMLQEYAGMVTVKIDGIAASAASVIAMAGDEVLMSPVSMMMIHNPVTIAIGDGEEMLKAKSVLDEVKESIINAYEKKTQLPRSKLSKLMDEETWMNAGKAMELGFADNVLYQDKVVPTASNVMIFSRQAWTNSLFAKMHLPQQAPPQSEDRSVPIAQLEKRLSLLPH